MKDIKLQIKEFNYAQNNEHGKNYTHTQEKKNLENASIYSSLLESS